MRSLLEPVETPSDNTEYLLCIYSMWSSSSQINSSCWRRTIQQEIVISFWLHVSEYSDSKSSTLTWNPGTSLPTIDIFFGPMSYYWKTTLMAHFQCTYPEQHVWFHRYCGISWSWTMWCCGISWSWTMWCNWQRKHDQLCKQMFIKAFSCFSTIDLLQSLSRCSPGRYNAPKNRKQRWLLVFKEPNQNTQEVKMNAI